MCAVATTAGDPLLIGTVLRTMPSSSNCAGGRDLPQQTQYAQWALGVTVNPHFGRPQSVGRLHHWWISADQCKLASGLCYARWDRIPADRSASASLCGVVGKPPTGA
jgi:hypothetical protein